MVSISLEEVGEITKGFSDGGEDEEEICGDWDAVREDPLLMFVNIKIIDYTRITH